MYIVYYITSIQHVYCILHTIRSVLYCITSVQCVYCITSVQCVYCITYVQFVLCILYNIRAVCILYNIRTLRYSHQTSSLAWSQGGTRGGSDEVGILFHPPGEPHSHPVDKQSLKFLHSTVYGRVSWIMNIDLS